MTSTPTSRWRSRPFSPTAILVVLLIVVGLGLALLKKTQLHVPLQPMAESSLWLIEAQLDFEGRNQPAKISLQLPSDSPSASLMNESFISRAFGLAVLDKGTSQRIATWTRRRTPDREQGLYYRLEVHHSEDTRQLHGRLGSKVPAFPAIPDYREPLASAISSSLADARERSADVLSFSNQLLKILSDPLNPNSKVIRQSTSAEGWANLVTEILAGARIPARVIYGLSLDKDFTNRSLVPWLEVHNGNHWEGFDATSGDRGYPDNFFVWSYDSAQPFTASGVRDITLSFSATPRQILQTDLASYYQQKSDGRWAGISLDGLPVETQNLFMLLLTLPLGALVVAFMRVVIGIPTFGTFMPVLIALAFRETQILWGITFFLLVVFVGLALRILLAHLRLLLVPRLASMLVIVVLVMLLMTLLSSALGVQQGLSIGLFPMVILTLTIERMSIVWDERGPVETLQETAGTLLVAIVGYYVMNSDNLVHLMYYFPELLLVVLAACLMLGTYNGYRLTELFRFRELAVAALTSKAHTNSSDANASDKDGH